MFHRKKTPKESLRRRRWRCARLEALEPRQLLAAMVDTTQPNDQHLTSGLVASLPTSLVPWEAIADPNPGFLIGGELAGGSAELEDDGGKEDLSACQSLVYSPADQATDETMPSVVSDCELVELLPIDFLSTNADVLTAIRATHPQSVHDFFYAIEETFGEEIILHTDSVGGLDDLRQMLAHSINSWSALVTGNPLGTVTQPEEGASKDQNRGEFDVTVGEFEDVTSPGAIDRIPGPETGVVIGPERPIGRPEPSPGNASVMVPVVGSVTNKNPSLLDIGSLTIRESAVVTKVDVASRVAVANVKGRAPGSQFRYFRAALSSTAGPVSADVSQDNTLELASRDSYFAFMLDSSAGEAATAVANQRVALRRESPQASENRADHHRFDVNVRRRLDLRQPFQSLFQAAHEQRRVVILPQVEPLPAPSESLVTPVAEPRLDRADSSSDARSEDNEVSSSSGPRPSTTSAVLLVSMLGANHRQSATLLNRMLRRLVNLLGGR